MADQYFDTTAELGSEEEDEDFDEDTARKPVKRKQNGANGRVEDSSEEEEDDEDEEAARAVSHSGTFRLEMQC